MHKLLRESVIASVRRRVEQGDCPIEPRVSAETLENALLDTADDLQKALSSPTLHPSDREAIARVIWESRLFMNARNDWDTQVSMSPKSEPVRIVREVSNSILALCLELVAQGAQSAKRVARAIWGAEYDEDLPPEGTVQHAMAMQMADAAILALSGSLAPANPTEKGEL